MNQLRAKLKVSEVTTGQGYEKPELSAVYSSDPTTENYDFAQATPSVTLEMYISNPAAFGFFQVGEEYILTFNKPLPANEEKT